jgi:hypothetical protein
LCACAPAIARLSRARALQFILAMKVVIIVLLALSSIAHAEPQPERKSRGIALALAAAGTIVPGVVIGAGFDQKNTMMILGGTGTLMLSPSLGHWYAGEVFTTGMGVRIVGGGLALLSAAYLSTGDSGSNFLGFTLIGGVSLLATGTLMDVIAAPRAVDDWNAEHVEVTVVKTGNGYGLGVVGAF